jgi:hypothetical protein
MRGDDGIGDRRTRRVAHLDGHRAGDRGRPDEGQGSERRDRKAKN